MATAATTRARLRRPVALVLSGGASLGALQVGQLRAIADAGIVPDLIVGTSVGAINGLFVARAFTRERIARLVEVWHGLKGRGVFAGVGPRNVLRFLRGTGSLASPAPLERLVRRELPRDAKDLALPAHVIATDQLTGAAVVLSDGDLQRNALASAAIPSIFPPVEVGGRLLVDGGISANVPLAPAARLGARTLIVLDAGYPCVLERRPRGVVANVLHALTLALRSQVAAVLPVLARDRTILYLPAPCPLATAPYDFSATADLIAAGEALAAEALRAAEPGAPGVQGHPHLHAGEASPPEPAREAS